MKKKSDLSICIVNYNTRELLQNCLRSILKNKGELSLELLLSDNHSTDGSIAMVTKFFSQVKIIGNRENLFFHRALNKLLRIANGRYFLILNSDTIIHPHTLPKLVSFMDKGGTALTSCRHQDTSAATDSTCSRFPHPLLEIVETSLLARLLPKSIRQKILENYRYLGWRRNTIREVEVLPGSFLLGRKELLKTVGLFDENLALFYGDADYCQRVRDAGYKISHYGKAVITHLRSQTIARLPPQQLQRIVRHDLFYFYAKYYGRLWRTLIWLVYFPT